MLMKAKIVYSNVAQQESLNTFKQKYTVTATLQGMAKQYLFIM